jgi:hypothetical protein
MLRTNPLNHDLGEANRDAADEKQTPAVEDPKRKNYRLRQSKIDRAREILGTRTETETIEQALDLVVFGERLRRGVDRMRGRKLVHPDV